MLKAVKVRIYPKPDQQLIIHQHFGAVRYIFNHMLALRSKAYKRFNLKLDKFQLNKHITHLRSKENLSWLKKIDSQALQQANANLDTAYKNFFKKTGDYPMFKSKHRSPKSYQIPQRVRVEGKKLYIPKVGLVKMKGWRNFAGKIKTVTISERGGLYFASILMDVEMDYIPVRNFKSVGIDVGVVNLITDSEGFKFKSSDLEYQTFKLANLQRRLSSKVKFSNNWYKIKRKISRQHLRISDIKTDNLHKLSRHYSENQTVVVEDLNIKGMSKSASGTIENPGTNVSAKRGLNRSIQERSWGKLYEMLEYKLAQRGGRLVRVDPKYTSQRCSCCGHIAKENRKSQSVFICTNCSFSANADVNAAINIRDLGVQGLNAFSKSDNLV